MSKTASEAIPDPDAEMERLMSSSVHNPRYEVSLTVDGFCGG